LIRLDSNGEETEKVSRGREWGRERVRGQGREWGREVGGKGS
jgi:hypothetical protein